MTSVVASVAEEIRTAIPGSGIDCPPMVDPIRGETPHTRVGVDVGGTFTDAVVVSAHGIFAAKVPTTPHDQGEGVVAAVAAALNAAGATGAEVRSLAHGMTVGTNALLERRGARVCLITTQGFEDILELRRQDRASLYRLEQQHPAPLVRADHVIGARERMTPTGIELPLDDDAIREVVAAVVALSPESVAIGLLFAYRDPSHETALASAIRAALPGVPISVSSEVLPEIREYERVATTALDAYLAPVLFSYLDRLAGRTEAAGLPDPSIMQSSGGLMSLGAAATHAARTVLSGPAGGLVGAAMVAASIHEPLALAFDMGGTSCDVALIDDGEPARAHGRTVAGHPVHLPMLDIHTVSAGGGSIAWADGGGALRVGPHSAAAVPGPAAYGLGGTEPTVTDANVVLGRVAGDLGAGGEIHLDRARALEAVTVFGEQLGLPPVQCAEGILAVAVSQMVGALRVVSVERGIDPRDGVLIAFGGAGPMHACDVADSLQIARIACPASAGVLAALGMVVAGERCDHVQTVLLPAGDHAALARAVAPLLAMAMGDVPGGRIEAHADCRYIGQSHALTIPWDPQDPDAGLTDAFHAAHERASGGAMPGRAVEVVSLRVAAISDGPEIPGDPAAPAGPPIPGPISIPMAGSTCWVAHGWVATAHTDGAITMERL